MAWTLGELERRSLPAPVYAAGGVVHAAGAAWQAFPGWDGPLSVAADGDRVYVGAGPGGGPRVAAFDSAGRRLADAFAFEPSFRGGVEVAAGGGRVYVSPGPGGGPVLKTLTPDLTELSAVYVGDPAGRDGLRLAAVPAPVTTTVEVPRPPADLTIGDGHSAVVFVDAEGVDPNAVKAVVTLAAAESAGTDLTFTTVRPAMPPGRYLTVLFGPDLSWFDLNHGGVGDTVGLAPVVWNRVPLEGETVPNVVYAEHGKTVTDVPRSAALVLHETGHFFGLNHGIDPTDVMYSVLLVGQDHYSRTEAETVRVNALAFAHKFGGV